MLRGKIKKQYGFICHERKIKSIKMEFIFDKGKLKRAGTARFPYTSWVFKVIKEWYWYIDEGEGEKKGDCLEAYYEVKAVNG